MTLSRRPLFLIVAMLTLGFAAPTFVHAADEESPLAKAMDELGDHCKALRKTVRDPAKNAESLELITKAQQATLTSKMHMPAMLEKAPEAERAKLAAGYRKMMADVMVSLCKLENQLVDGDNKAAEETVKELKDLEEKGHEVYNS